MQGTILLKKYSPEVIVFVVGALSMILEILALSIIASTFGNALTVSSNVIGIILLGLSLGYYGGGKLADRRSDPKIFSWILIASGMVVATIVLFQDYVSIFVRFHIADVAIGSMIAIFLLFLPPMCLLGIILPFAVKLKVHAFEDMGRREGWLYALSALGSVAGTFLAALFLIPYIPFPYILLAISFILILCGALWHAPLRPSAILIPFLFLLFSLTRGLTYTPVFTDSQISFDGGVIIDRSKMQKIADSISQYSRIEVFDALDEVKQEPLRIMRVNHEMHSATYLDSNELVFQYAQYNRLGGHFNPAARSALLVGGGGYSYAKYFLGDTPLFDQEKRWILNGNIYSNNKKVTVPILITSDRSKQGKERQLIFQATSTPQGSEIEGAKNFINAHNQAPSSEIVVDKAEINDTGLPCNKGYVHIHETKTDGKPGEVISANYYIHNPRNIIGHSKEIAGLNYHVKIVPDRPLKEGETLYAMLHRDNCNNLFDPILVDGYENMEKLDVVEIDLRTTEFAEKYFGLLTSDPRLHVFHEDGRTYINRTQSTYDIVYFDAFRSFYSVPFQLTTRESVQKLYDILNDRGVVVFNIPSALAGPMGKSFQAEYKTLSTVFPQLKVFASTSPSREKIVQNIIVIAFKSKDPIRTFPNDDKEINDELMHEWSPHIEPGTPILTDDYAPVDYYINALINIPTM